MSRQVSRFDRKFFDGKDRFTCIGSGEVGGKASGLLRIHDVLRARLGRDEFRPFRVDIPTLTVVATDVFDAFLERNSLRDLALSDLDDDRIAEAFQKGAFPAEYIGDLRALIEQIHTPLAIRSSSMLEDAMYRPFAGVYATKMVPNNQLDPDSRFRRLMEAIRFVWASTFFSGARNYLRATDHSIGEEKMAVIIQEVVGRRHGDRFYPHISGVARSYGFYRSGHARPEDGVVNLALGLGKTIVDGGAAWSYSPAYPRAAPPFGSVRELIKQVQLDFWTVNMGRPPAYDPIRETEYLLKAGITDAEEDGTLPWLASTYDAASDRLFPGVGSPGARVINFAPLLVHDGMPLNALVRRLLGVCEDELGEKVEIEFAAALGREGDDPSDFGFLQVRPMVVSEDFVEVTPQELDEAGVLIASDSVMGNGVVSGVRDIVYVRPGSFEARLTGTIAAQVARRNDALLGEGRPYLLIGFGRWGSSDPWLGIRVDWGQICGAKVIVEATLPTMNVDLSEGSHFFHNISSFGVSYFCVRHEGRRRIDWEWLDMQPAVAETDLVRHIRLDHPLTIKVDGRTGRGVVRK